ncbi:MAG: hypothetical protein H6707_18970 [Deltaproteobacteria bacterium]|nr:hypothetical protein [Deltaproteobacteria bacterium]
MRLRLGTLLLSSSVLCAGCFSPDFGDGGFDCSSERRCPDGYRCAETEPNVFQCRQAETVSRQPTVKLSFENPVITYQGQSVVFSPDGALSVSVATTQFELVNKPGSAHVTGQGHAHLYIDTPLSDRFIPPYITEENKVFNTKAEIKGSVVQGLHTLYVVLMQNDHVAIRPTVLDQAKFFVGARPSNAP